MSDCCVSTLTCRWRMVQHWCVNEQRVSVRLCSLMFLFFWILLCIRNRRSSPPSVQPGVCWSRTNTDHCCCWRTALWRTSQVRAVFVDTLTNHRPYDTMTSPSTVPSGIDTSEPNAVVVGLAPDHFNYQTLNTAFRWITSFFRKYIFWSFILKTECRCEDILIFLLFVEFILWWSAAC